MRYEHAVDQFSSRSREKKTHDTKTVPFLPRNRPRGKIKSRTFVALKRKCTDYRYCYSRLPPDDGYRRFVARLFPVFNRPSIVPAREIDRREKEQAN